jgi:transposase-like protein
MEATMMAYSKELRDSIVKRILSPNNESISKISQEEGLPEGTLRKWREAARVDGYAAPATDAPSEKWSTEDKFLIVIETAGKSQIELAEYCRQKGLYVEQVQTWKDACMQANGGVAQESARLNRELKQKDKEVKNLEKELQRKEKALAETAAILVLRKKADAIWGDPGED